MSKFIEKLKNHTQISPAPLGFGKAPVQEKPRMLLVAHITDADIKNPSGYVSGADAGLLDANSLSSLIDTLPKLSQASPDILWGGWLKNAPPEKVEIKNITADFLAFPPTTPLFELPAKLGRILEIDAGIPDTQLRAIDDLPVEAVLFTGNPDLINWQYLITLQRLENLLAKPLLVMVTPKVTITELQTLWSVGVDGVVMEVETTTAGVLKELRQEVEKAVFPLPRKAKKVDVMLPFISPTPPGESEEEEDE